MHCRLAAIRLCLVAALIYVSPIWLKMMSLSDRIYRWLVGQPGKRMPLKEPPLRVPGQALSNECDLLIIELVLLLMMPIAIGVIVLWSCAKLAWQQLGSPLWAAAISVAIVAVGLIILIVPVLLVWWWMFHKRVKRLRCYKLGLLAERYVGQQLERCRYLDYSVFHDIQVTKGKKTFNIDHVLIGPGGIFVVETKARSIPLEQKGRPVLKFDGVRLTFPDGYDTEGPVNQTEANANYLKKLLLDLLRKKVGPTHCDFTWENPPRVVPILVYPGWWIDFEEAKGKTTVKVLEDNGLVDFIKNAGQFERLTKPQYIELRDLLGAHLRDQRRDILITA